MMTYFSDGSLIDYVRMSKDLNLHRDALDFFANQTKRAGQTNHKLNISSQMLDNLQASNLARLIQNNQKKSIFESGALYDSLIAQRLKPTRTQGNS